MLRALVSKLWSKIVAPPAEPPPAPKPVDNRTAFDRAVQRNPNLLPKGMAVVDFALWCQEIGEDYEAAIEFYSETLVLKDPAEAKKIAAEHADEDVPSLVAAMVKNLGHVQGPNPGQGPDDQGPNPGHDPSPNPGRDHGQAHGTVTLIKPIDIARQFTIWARPQPKPPQGCTGNELVTLYRRYCRDTGQEPLKTEVFLQAMGRLEGVKKVRQTTTVYRNGKKQRPHLWQLPSSSVVPLKKVA